MSSLLGENIAETKKAFLLSLPRDYVADDLSGPVKEWRSMWQESELAMADALANGDFMARVEASRKFTAVADQMKAVFRKAVKDGNEDDVLFFLALNPSLYKEVVIPTCPNLFHYAMSSKNPNLFFLLWGMHENQFDENDAYYAACCNRGDIFTKAVEEWGFDVNHPFSNRVRPQNSDRYNFRGGTALHYAAHSEEKISAERSDSVFALLRLGADPMAWAEKSGGGHYFPEKLFPKSRATPRHVRGCHMTLLLCFCAERILRRLLCPDDEALYCGNKQADASMQVRLVPQRQKIFPVIIDLCQKWTREETARDAALSEFQEVLRAKFQEAGLLPQDSQLDGLARVLRNDYGALVRGG